jgi:hypothetical protein
LGALGGIKKDFQQIQTRERGGRRRPHLALRFSLFFLFNLDQGEFWLLFPRDWLCCVLLVFGFPQMFKIFSSFVVSNFYATADFFLWLYRLLVFPIACSVLKWLRAVLVLSDGRSEGSYWLQGGLR